MACERRSCVVMFLLLLAIGFAMGDIPGCEYYETVELSDTDRLANGSYIYSGVIIPAKLIGEYEYVETVEGVRETATKHIRGCICKLKACIRFCCNDPKASMTLGTHECSSNSNNYKLNPYVRVIDKNDKIVIVNVQNFFVPLKRFSCQYAYPYEPETSPQDSWQLFANGTVLRINDGVILRTWEFCLHPYHLDESTERSFQLYGCGSVNQPKTFEVIKGYVMSVSVICMVITILVFVFIRKLTNHRKSLVNYLIAISVGYLVLIVTIFVRNVPDVLCTFLGYLGYFAFITAFLWLTIISSTMWNSLRENQFYLQRSENRGRIFVYALYAWGGAASLTLITCIADFLNIDEDFRPRVGESTCWIQTQNSFSAYIYFYGPMLLLIVFNLVMFILTAKRIYDVKQNIQKSINKIECSQRLNSDQQNFSLFLRLFVLMGITWLLEILSYTLESTEFGEILAELPDSLNAAQGIIIFILFVDVKLVYRRMAQTAKRAPRKNMSGQQLFRSLLQIFNRTSLKPVLSKSNI